MTSEVVVMNSLGVALASDSAATVNNGEGGKVFNTADKLFMLSKRHPVGVMVYDNAAILGVPWETIIKMFRRQLDSKPFANLEDYGRALVAYLDNNERLFPPALQDRFYLRSLETLYASLAGRIEDVIYERLVEGSDSSQTPADIARELVTKERDRWASEPEASCLQAGGGARLTGRFSGEISTRPVPSSSRSCALPRKMRFHHCAVIGSAEMRWLKRSHSGRANSSRQPSGWRVTVSCPPACALRTSRCRVGTDKRPLASRLMDETPWNTWDSLE